jgi:hypothetical protein
VSLDAARLGVHLHALLWPHGQAAVHNHLYILRKRQKREKQ